MQLSRNVSVDSSVSTSSRSPGSLWPRGPDTFTASDLNETLTIIMARQDLDGPHKHNKSNKVPIDLVVRISFDELPQGEAQEEGISRERLRKQSAKALKRRSTKKQCESYSRWTFEDYDEMEDETDNEAMLMTLHRGYLRRDRGRCYRPYQCWCELHKSGRFYAHEGRGALVADLAKHGQQAIQAAKGDRSGQLWRIWNSDSSQWELFEASEKDCGNWNVAFSDAIALGRATRDPDTAFVGFLLKKNHDVDDATVVEQFDCSQWRLRLFVLRNGGELALFPEDGQDIIILSFLGTALPH